MGPEVVGTEIDLANGFGVDERIDPESNLAIRKTLKRRAQPTALEDVVLVLQLHGTFTSPLLILQELDNLN